MSLGYKTRNGLVWNIAKQAYIQQDAASTGVFPDVVYYDSDHGSFVVHDWYTVNGHLHVIYITSAGLKSEVYKPVTKKLLSEEAILSLIKKLGGNYSAELNSYVLPDGRFIRLEDFRRCGRPLPANSLSDRIFTE